MVGHAVPKQLDRIEAMLVRLTNTILKGESVMAQDLSVLKAEVAANTTVVGSAVALINGFSARLDAAVAAAGSADPALAAELAALSAQIKADSGSLAAAVAANTPAAPVAPPVSP